MQLGELILHYRPEGDQNNSQVRIWSQNNTTEGLLNGDKLLKFQIDQNNGKTYLTGPALTIQNAENTLTMRNIKNFYVTADGILDVELE